jgi:hypothetical protein
VKRENVGEYFGKREMWKINSMRQFWEKRIDEKNNKKNEMALEKSVAICSFFFLLLLI